MAGSSQNSGRWGLLRLVVTLIAVLAGGVAGFAFTVVSLYLFARFLIWQGTDPTGAGGVSFLGILLVPIAVPTGAFGGLHLVNRLYDRDERS